MTNPQWTMAGIFADEGISGTSASKRPAFLRMIRQCRQGKIDLVLVKSISRFARNTVDCLNYIRALRAMRIAVIFEKENINTLEDSLQAAILAAVNDAMSQREVLVERIAGAMRAELVSLPGECLRLSDIERQLDGLNQEFQVLFKQTSGADYMSRAEDFKRISDEMSTLKEKRVLLLERQNSDSAVNRRIQDAVDILNSGSPEITEWDESMIRQLVDTVTVLSANKIRVYFRGGMESEQVLKDIR